MTIRIRSARGLMWYSTRIGEEFTVIRIDSHGYWCREGGQWNCLNWVDVRDALIV